MRFILTLILYVGPFILACIVLIGGGYWFIRYGYTKLKDRWRVSRGWTAAFLALWFISATFGLAYSDLNKLLYLKTESIPNLLAGINRLGYQLSHGLSMPDPKYHFLSFEFRKPVQGDLTNVAVYLPPRSHIEEVLRDGSRLDLQSSTGSARLYYVWYPSEQAHGQAIVLAPNREYEIIPYNRDLSSGEALYAALIRGEFPQVSWFQETRTYWNAEASFFRWLRVYSFNHGDAILAVPIALLPLSAMLWAPVIALLPAGVFTFLPLWLWLIAFLAASTGVTLWWLRLTRAGRGKGEES